MKNHILSLCLLMAVCLQSCSMYDNGCEQNITCTVKTDIPVVFHGFTKPEVDTIIYQVYKSDSNGIHKVDAYTTMFDSSKVKGPYSKDADSNLAYRLVGGNGRDSFYTPKYFWSLTPWANYEYEIIVPGAGKTYRIAGITLDGTATEKKEVSCYEELGTPCYREVTSYKVDNVQVSRASGKLPDIVLRK